jgi:hypothetical protein
MPKEKRNNLAIYTLAGSILLSSVLVSMNQVNAHTADSKKIKTLETAIRILASDSTDLTWCMNENIDTLATFFGSSNLPKNALAGYIKKC